MRRSPPRFLMLECFLRVHERGSVSDGARDLGISQSNATRLLKDLEALLGAELIHRTTRGLSTTAAGLSLAEDARSLIGDWNALMERHRGDRDANVSLRIVAPVGIGQHVLFDLVADFVLLNSGLSVDWRLENGEIAFHVEGPDLWVCLGPVRDGSLVVREVGHLPTTIVAAPSHASSDVAGDVAALERHEIVAIDPYHRDAIEIILPDGDRRSIEPTARIRTNNFPSMYRAVRRGLGYAIMPTWFVASDIESGRLIDLLPGCTCGTLSISLVYSARKYRSPVLQSLIRHLSNEIPKIAGIEAAGP